MVCVEDRRRQAAPLAPRCVHHDDDAAGTDVLDVLTGVLKLFDRARRPQQRALELREEAARLAGGVEAAQVVLVAQDVDILRLEAGSAQHLGRASRGLIARQGPDHTIGRIRHERVSFGPVHLHRASRLQPIVSALHVPCAEPIASGRPAVQSS